MKTTIISLSFLLVSSAAIAQNALLQWGKQYKGTGFDIGTHTVLDKNGNVFTTVVFDAVIDFDPGPGSNNIFPVGSQDLGIAKLDPSGNLLWVAHIGGVGDEVATNIAVDTMGNVYATGYFTDEVDFDPGPGTYTLFAADEDAYVLKLTSSGAFSWVSHFEGTGFGSGDAIVVDNTGNVYTTGYFDGTVDFDPGAGAVTLTVTAFGDTYVSKLSSTGNYIFVKALESQDFVDPAAISLDPSQNIIVSGVYSQSTDFDPSGGTNVLNSNSGFVLKLDNTGNFVYVKDIGGEPTDQKVDGTGNIIVAGIFSGSVDFDPGAGTTVLNAIQNDYFVLKLTNAGNFSWVQHSGTSDNAYAYAVDADNAGNIYFGGHFDNTVDLDAGTGTYSLAAIGAEDVFLAKIDGNGNFVWGGQVGGTDLELLLDMTVDAGGNNIHAGGIHLSNDLDLDPGTGTFTVATTTGFFDIDVFMLKFNICDLMLDPNSTATLCANGTATMAATSTGSVSWYTSPTTTTSVGNSTLHTAASLAPGTYTYYAGSSSCGSARVAHDVTVHALPVINGSLSHTVICVGHTSTIYVTGAASYSVNGTPTTSGFSVSPAMTTTYVIAGTDTNGCVDSTTVVQTVDLCTGIATTRESAFTIFPNPAKDEFSLVSDNDGCQLNVITIDGSLVKTQSLSPGMNTISCGDLASGVYFVMLVNNGQTSRTLLVVQ